MDRLGGEGVLGIVETIKEATVKKGLSRFCTKRRKK